MAIETTNKDISTRGVTNTTLAQFAGRARQVVINIDDGFRPIVMDGSTLGGKFKVASLADIETALDEYKPSGNFLTVETAAATYATKSEVTSSLAGKANATHTHAQADITGLSAALDAKANTSHSHNQSDVVGLEAALAGKAAAVHTHEIANVSGLQTALDSKQAAGNYSTVGHTHTKADVTDFAHTHATSEVTGLDTALATKADSSALTSLIPKTGARGQLAGYESITEDTQNLTITASSPDDQITSGTVTVSAASLDGISWTKTVLLTGASPQVSLDSSWAWVGGSAPTLTQYGLLVLAKRNGVGIANFVSKS